MKKVRLSLRRGVKSWSFSLYDSPESAYFMTACAKDVSVSQPLSDDDYKYTVTLLPGQKLEVEWLGSEYVYLGAPSQKITFENIRLGKLSVLRDAWGSVDNIETAFGWVPGDVIPWVDDPTRNDVRITRITGRRKPLMDFSRLFSDQPDDVGAVVGTNVKSVPQPDLN